MSARTSDAPVRTGRASRTKPPIAEWVKERRLSLGIRTQKELADLMGETETNYVARIEAGYVQVPQQPYLARLARSLRVTQADVLREAGLIDDRLEPDRVLPEEAAGIEFGWWANTTRRLLAEALPSLKRDDIEELLLHSAYLMQRQGFFPGWDLRLTGKRAGNRFAVNLDELTRGSEALRLEAEPLQPKGTD